MAIPYYMSPEEGMAADIDRTDKALGWAVAKLGYYLQEKESIRLRLEQLDPDEDEEEVADLDWKRKLLKEEEATVIRIMSGLQSRLKICN